MNDDDVRKKYDALPYLDGEEAVQAYSDLKYGMYTGGFLLLLLVVAVATGHGFEAEKDEIANEIYRIQTDKFTCDELMNKLKPLRISSWRHDDYIKSELYDRLYEDECISYTDQQRMQDEDWCRLSDSMQCRVKAIAAKELAGEEQRWKKR